MTNREFVKWLSGFFELAESESLNRKQLYVISNHLNLAEAVEGQLGEFNQKIRAMVSGQIDKLSGPDELADIDMVAQLKEMVLRQAEII